MSFSMLAMALPLIGAVAFASPFAKGPYLQDMGPAGVTVHGKVGALQVRLPAGVADIRVAQGKVTLYRASP